MKVLDECLMPWLYHCCGYKRPQFAHAILAMLAYSPEVRHVTLDCDALGTLR